MNKRLPGYMTVAAGFVPLACKMPYMFRAWRQSPLDRFDWIFGALFLAAAGISVMAALLIAVSFSLFARDTGHKA